jgi:hypothetical protein
VEQKVNPSSNRGKDVTAIEAGTPFAECDFENHANAQKNEHSKSNEQVSRALNIKILISELGKDCGRDLPVSAFPCHGLYLSYKLGSLKEASSTERMQFTRQAMELTFGYERLTPRQQSTFQKTFYHLTVNEKVRSIRSLLNKLDDSDSPTIYRQLVGLCLDSCKNNKNLIRVINRVGSAGLYEEGSKRIKNIVAHAKITQALGTIVLPRKLRSNAPSPTVTRRLNEIKAVLEERLKIVKRKRPYANTVVGKRFRSILERNLESLSIDRRTTHGVKARRELAAVYVDKIALECRYGIALTNERRASGTSTVQWSESTLRSVKRALEAFPEMTLTAVPKFAQMRLMEYLKDAYGQRDGTGLVKIATMSEKDSAIFAEYKGHDSMKLVVLHEVGHSIKFGPFTDGKDRKESINDLSRQSNPLVDLADFMRLSGWKVLPPESFQITEKSRSIRIDDKSYVLGDPVDYKGNMVVFRWDDGKKTLYYHDAGARFPVQSYGRYNPWEDWTESLTDYAFLPERLIEFAPWKFVYFEQRFNRHTENETVMALLNKELPELGGKL